MRYLTLLIKSNLVETPMVLKTTFCVLLMFVSGAAGLCAEAEVAELAAPGSRMFLRQGWKIQSSAKVPEKGSVISTVLFQPKGWYPTDIPSTVLAALVRNHVYPNPDFGMNLRSIPGTTYPIGANFSNIPMPSDSPFRPGWWYRTEFRLPPSARGKTLWLHFDGINYRANIWLNGREIASADQVMGMRRQFEFNITPWARPGEINTLALEIFAPTPNDLSITFVDWNPLPPDKDMGIFRDVYLTASGPIAVRHPQIVTHLNLPSLTVARLAVSAELRNVSDRPVKGILRVAIGEIEVSQNIQLAPKETRRVVITPESCPQLVIAHPRLWWPYQYGAQNLYRARIEFKTNGQVSDREDVPFGIREMTSQLDAQNHRVFLVNGKRILIRGAGWSPDMLLRLSPEREEDEIRYVKGMHLNTIRLEGKLMDDHFFDLCDRYGILVIAGWCCCSRWEHWRNWNAEDYLVAENSLRDQVRRLRNHPSILAFFYGSDNAPPAKPEAVYLKVFKEEQWPNPTVAAASSRKTVGAGWTGVKMTGPYQYVGPSYWYLDHQRGGAFGFNTETSPGPAIPVLASLREMLPADHLWPMDDVWNYHAGGGAFKDLRYYTQALAKRYGKPTGLEDYLQKAQVMDYEGERAMFEAFGRNKYTATGVIQWMLNNAWPSMIWHLYDFYLRPGGGYFGAQKACEPLHVQYSYDDRSVVVVNSTLHDFEHYKATAEVYNLDLKLKFSKSVMMRIPPDSSVQAFGIPELSGLSRTYFVRLSLQDQEGKIVSRNFYWLSTHPDVFNWGASTWFYTPLQSFADFRDLQRLPHVALRISAQNEVAGVQSKETVLVENPTRHLAFFVHMRVLKGTGGEDVHPILWQDNDFELMPGEKREVSATFRQSELNGAQPVVAVDGWNVTPQTSGK